MTTVPARQLALASHVLVTGPVLHRPITDISAQAGDGLPPATAGTLVWQLARDLQAHVTRVSVATLDQETARSVRIDRAGLSMVCGPLRRRHSMRDLMRVERTAVRDAVLALRPDIVHAHWCYQYALGALASGLPTLVTVHDWIPVILRNMDLRYWPYWSGRALLYAATLLRARHLTANSPYMASTVRRFARGAIEVVPNGLPDKRFLTAAGSSQDTAAHASPAFISVNNGFSPRKNVRVLLQALAEIRRRRQGAVRLHLVGDDYEPGGPCERWARTKGLHAGVSFVGRLPRERMISSLRDYVALVHPSREESFGMTLLEAMSQRVPVIGGARAGAVPWVLNGGTAGLLVDVNDPRTLATAMDSLVTDAALRSRLGEAGYAHAWQHFRQSRITAMYLTAYRRVLEDEARSR